MRYRPWRNVSTPWGRWLGGSESARDIAEARALYKSVTTRHQASRYAKDDAIKDVAFSIAKRIVEVKLIPEAIGGPFVDCEFALLALEPQIFATPNVNWDGLSLKELVDLKNFLRAQDYFLANEQKVLDRLIEALGNIFAGIFLDLPDLGESLFTVRLVDVLDEPNVVVGEVIGTFFDKQYANVGLFAVVSGVLYENVCRASNLLPYGEHKKPLTMPAESELPPHEVVDTYLSGTPFHDFFLAPVPLTISPTTRFEHCWAVAGSGHGKTTALQAMILKDLENVIAGEASIVVMDSQGDLIRHISRLNLFAPGMELADKLCLIDPTDVEFPVALNLFSLGKERLQSYSLLDRERLQNAAVELYEFILGALLGAEMTSKQSTLFRYVLRLMLLIDGATIHTFREIMEDTSKYKSAIARLSPVAREFFESEFEAKEYAQTRSQVNRRLWAIVENQTFERMFSHPQSKLDLFGEMNAGKVILINTAKDLLKQNGCEIFGRFFIALIAQAAQERATLSEKLPCYVYIDEFGDYAASADTNITSIFQQARKQNVAMTVAHQMLGDLSVKTQESLAANTSIKLVGGTSHADCVKLAKEMRTTHEFIEAQKKGSFACFIRNHTKAAVSLGFPAGPLENQPKMNDGDWRTVRRKIRERYATSLEELEARQQPEHEAPSEATEAPKPARAGRSDTATVKSAPIDPSKPARY